MCKKMKTPSPNKITGANAGGPCQLEVPTHRAGRVTQFVGARVLPVSGELIR